MTETQLAKFNIVLNKLNKALHNMIFLLINSYP